MNEGVWNEKTQPVSLASYDWRKAFLSDCCLNFPALGGSLVNAYVTYVIILPRQLHAISFSQARKFEVSEQHQQTANIGARSSYHHENIQFDGSV